MIIWLSILLGISILVNILLIWYIRKMLQKLLFVSDNIGDFLENIDEFSKHLSGIHELEMFYGDETLTGLIKHSKEIVENIKEFEEIYSLTRENLVQEGGSSSGSEEEEE